MMDDSFEGEVSKDWEADGVVMGLAVAVEAVREVVAPYDAVEEELKKESGWRRS